MPKKIEGVNEGKLTTSLDVPQAGEPRVAANIEGPVRILLNNTLFLFRLAQDVASAIGTHTHALVTETKEGFMSPGDKQKLNGLSGQLAAHAHAVATTLAPGFMSKEDKVKLNGVETGAQVVSKTRILEALDIRVVNLNIPEATLAAGQQRSYSKSVPGLKYDAPWSASEITKAGAFLLSYHADPDLAQLVVRNISDRSATNPAAVITVIYFNGLANN